MSLRLARALLRPTPFHSKAFRCRQISTYPTPKAQAQGGRTATLLGFGGAILAYQAFSSQEVQAESLPKPPLGPSGASTSQHAQVLKSWKNLGVYAWGSNKGRVVAPDSKEDYVRVPRRLTFFDDVVLRDLRMDSDVGVAVTENGDLLQWGIGYSEGIKKPELTLAGKNLQRVEMSADRIFALSKDGIVYSLPKSKKEQEEGYKPSESGWIFFVKGKAKVSYKKVELPLSHFEKVTDISAGLEHLLYLTSIGRVFSSAAAYAYPARGQLGIAGLNWNTRPKDRPYDTPFEISVEGKPKITQVATGDYHSLALDDQGRVWSFGDNTYGQLGFDYHPELQMRDIPTKVSIQSLYPVTDFAVKCTQLGAGGLNSYYLVDAKDDNGQVRADVWASGQGLWGALGTGTWRHAQGQPAKIKTLSGLVEYDETENKVKPVRVAYIAPGPTHTAAVVSTHSNTSNTSEFFYGHDVLWWGNNEFYQLGNGKRNNMCIPSYIAPLDSSPIDIENVEKPLGQAPQHRLQVTPKARTVLGDGRKLEVEQRVITGKGVSGVYSKVS